MCKLGVKGSVALVAAAAMGCLVILSFMGFDLMRVYLVQSRLQTALDASVLVAAREIDLPQTTLDSDTAAMFWSNFAGGQTENGTSYFGSTATAPILTPQPDGNTINISATATVTLVLGGFIGLPQITLTDTAQAVRATTGLEIALVLDNTGSMAGAPMQSEISAATQLVNILYGTTNGVANDTVPNLYISVVPFTAEVNIGSNHASWLAPGSLDENSYANTSWQGCVLARHAGGHDADDAKPSVAPFQPFLYVSTLGKYKNSKGVVLAGDNDWSPTNITESKQASYGNATVGPDLGCAATPILPETQSRTTVLNTINSMQATYRGGTFINLGLQAGWLTISPNWVGLWGSPNLPLPYNTKNMVKAIVLMTDGNNSWYSWSGSPPNGGAPDNEGDTDYTSYERISDQVLGSGVTQANATTILNNSMVAMCQTIKSNGILLYTILFNHDSGITASTESLFQNCATSPQDYFFAPTDQDLETAFGAIGSQLASLRLSQ